MAPAIRCTLVLVTFALVFARASGLPSPDAVVPEVEAVAASSTEPTQPEAIIGNVAADVDGVLESAPAAKFGTDMAKGAATIIGTMHGGDKILKYMQQAKAFLASPKVKEMMKQGEAEFAKLMADMKALFESPAVKKMMMDAKSEMEQLNTQATALAAKPELAAAATAMKKDLQALMVQMQDVIKTMVCNPTAAGAAIGTAAQADQAMLADMLAKFKALAGPTKEAAATAMSTLKNDAATMKTNIEAVVASPQAQNLARDELAAGAGAASQLATAMATAGDAAEHAIQGAMEQQVQQVQQLMTAVQPKLEDLERDAKGLVNSTEAAAVYEDANKLGTDLAALATSSKAQELNKDVVKEMTAASAVVASKLEKLPPAGQEMMANAKALGAVLKIGEDDLKTMAESPEVAKLAKDVTQAAKATEQAMAKATEQAMGGLQKNVAGMFAAVCSKSDSL